MLLAGDLGGTKTLLGLFRKGGSRPQPVDIREFTTLDYPDLPSIVERFLQSSAIGSEAIEAACIGVAGPILDQTAVLTNVPWAVSAADVVARTDVRSLWLLNDVEAMGYSVQVLEDHELAILQEGERAPNGNAALIAPGTGLGHALLYNRNGRWVPVPSEAGHADFAARTEREFALARDLIARYGRVDTERVVSGLGLVNISRFTHGGRCPHADDNEDVSSIPPRVTANAMAGRCAACVEALDLFVSAFGAAAGNLALYAVATGGIFLGGGIPPKILPALKDGRFLEAFRNKAPLDDMMSAVPIAVILNPRAGLLGAAVYASRMATD